MTTAALSISVQKVESEIGMAIFNRDKKPLELTEAGKLYVENIEQTMYQEEELLRKINDLSELRTGFLRVGGTHYFNSYILPPIFTEFHQKWPGISLEIIEDGSYELLDKLKENKIDLTFNCSLSHMSTFRRTPAFQDNILLAVPATFNVNQTLYDSALTAKDVMFRKHLLPDCPSITLESLSHTPFILLTEKNNLYTRSMSMFKQANIMPIVSTKVSQLVTAYHLASAGMAATFISNWMVLYEHNNMLYYKLEYKEATRVFDVVTSSKNYLSKPQNAFISLFTTYYKPYLR